MIDVDYNQYKETLEENMRLIVENHKLKERIDKAIKYIEEKEEILLNCDDEWLDHDEMVDKKRFKKILEILKGGNK